MIDIYETENSKYEIDLVNRRYRRNPIKGGTPQSPRLKYGEWLPLKDIPNPVTVENGRLHIMHESSTYGIVTSPITFTFKGLA